MAKKQPKVIRDLRISDIGSWRYTDDDCDIYVMLRGRPLKRMDILWSLEQAKIDLLRVHAPGKHPPGKYPRPNEPA